MTGAALTRRERSLGPASRAGLRAPRRPDRLMRGADETAILKMMLRVFLALLVAVSPLSRRRRRLRLPVPPPDWEERALRPRGQGKTRAQTLCRPPAQVLDPPVPGVDRAALLGLPARAGARRVQSRVDAGAHRLRHRGQARRRLPGPPAPAALTEMGPSAWRTPGLKPGRLWAVGFIRRRRQTS
jgi:hypothetical protein